MLPSWIVVWTVYNLKFVYVKFSQVRYSTFFSYSFLKEMSKWPLKVKHRVPMDKYVKGHKPLYEDIRQRNKVLRYPDHNTDDGKI